VRLSLLAGLCALLGCLSSPAQDPLQEIDVSSKEPSCVRDCSRSYSVCIGDASEWKQGGGSDVPRGCARALQTCADACPPAEPDRTAE
jgi:hypothetical protein